MLVIRGVCVLSLLLARVGIRKMDRVAEYLCGVFLVAELLGSSLGKCVAGPTATLSLQLAGLTYEIGAIFCTERHVLSLVSELNWPLSFVLTPSVSPLILAASLEIERFVLV